MCFQPRQQKQGAKALQAWRTLPGARTIKPRYPSESRHGSSCHQLGNTYTLQGALNVNYLGSI
jgi:hypothetical protein